jgi:hypothetical protein
MFKTSVHGSVAKGFFVALNLCAGSDEMIEEAYHFALFEDRRDAADLADKIQKARRFDPKFWLWTPSNCSAWEFMHQKPVAVREVTPRKATARIEID